MNTATANEEINEEEIKKVLEKAKRDLFNERLQPYIENYIGHLFSVLPHISSEEQLDGMMLVFIERRANLLDKMREELATLQGMDKELYDALGWWTFGAMDSAARTAQVMIKLRDNITIEE